MNNADACGWSDANKLGVINPPIKPKIAIGGPYLTDIIIASKVMPAIPMKPCVGPIKWNKLLAE